MWNNKLVLLLATLLLTGCAHHVSPLSGPQPGTSRMNEPDRSPLATVALRVDQHDSSHRVFREESVFLIASETWWYDAEEWTKHLRDLLAVELRARGISVSEQADTTIGLKVVRFAPLPSSPRDLECVVQWTRNDGAIQESRYKDRIPAIAFDPFTPLLNKAVETIAREIAERIRNDFPK